MHSANFLFLRPASYLKELKMAKKKATEENLINVDEVYTKTEQFVDKNRNQLTYGLGGAALIILLIAGYKQLIVKPANDAAEIGSLSISRKMFSILSSKSCSIHAIARLLSKPGS